MSLANRALLVLALALGLGLVGCDGGGGGGDVDSGPGADAATPVDAGGGSDSGSPADAGQDGGMACTVGCDWVELALGFEHSCIRRENGEVWCWGRNHRRELGDGLARHTPGCPVEGDADQDCASRPVRVSHPEPATALSAHGSISTCLLDESRTAFCWGEDAFDIDGMPAGMRATPTAFPGYDDVEQLSEGWLHLCAIDSAGVPTCAGHNGSGQIGDGNQMTVFRPTPVLRRADGDPTMSVPLTDVLEIRTATNFGSFTCARTATTLYCWGSNRSGQLGIMAGEADAVSCFDAGEPYDCARTAVPVTGIDASTITQLSLGSSHACALTSAGTVWCWGDNRAGQLGLGDTAPHTVPTEVAGLTEVVEIAAGASHTCVRRESGEVLCTGINAQGQIGDGVMTHMSCTIGSDLRDCVSSFTPVMGIDDATELAVGRTHSCVIRSDQTVWCWGANDKLQLGDGPSTPPTPAQRAPRYAPVQVIGLPT